MTSTNEKIRAYVLINTELGASERVVKHLSNDPNVLSVASTTGTFDFIVKVEVNRISDFEEVISKRIQKIPGIKRTETQVIIKEVEQNE